MSSAGSRSLHIALLFACHFILGTFVAVWATYQYEQSRWFASLTQAQNRELLSFRETLLSAPIPASSTPTALQRDLIHLESLRAQAASEAQPILDLRIAADHALLARLDGQANDTPAAAAQAQAARSLLHQLGWTDLSDAALSELADQRLRATARKDVR